MGRVDAASTLVWTALTAPLMVCLVSMWIALNAHEAILPAAIIGWAVGQIAGVGGGWLLRHAPRSHAVAFVMLPPSVAVVVEMTSGRSGVAVCVGGLLFIVVPIASRAASRRACSTKRE